MAKPSQAVDVSSEQREERMRGEEGDESAESLFVGDDPGFQMVHRFIRELGASTSSVLITGERGTGKTLMARALHVQSPRSRESLVIIHCSIFTDPIKQEHAGSQGTGKGECVVDGMQRYIEKAEGGTLLLEEVGLLPLGVQDELVKLLGTKKTDSQPSNVRILSTSSGNLSALVQKQLFHQRLFDQLAIESIHLPTLREVPGNLSALTAFLFDQVGRAMGRHEPLSFDAKAMKHVRQYPWPGNVKELKQEVERLVRTYPKHTFAINDLSDCIHYYKEPMLNGPPLTDVEIFQSQSFVLPIV